MAGGVLWQLNKALTQERIGPMKNYCNYVTELITAMFANFALAFFKHRVGSMIGAFVVPSARHFYLLRS